LIPPGQIARELDIEQDIRIERFRNTKLLEDRTDQGSVTRPSPSSTSTTRAGSSLCIITLSPNPSTHFTLDKQNAATREYLSSWPTSGAHPPAFLSNEEQPA
jgi:hypothetical protein